MLLALFLAACTASESRSLADDREAYLRGLHAPLETATTACKDVRDPHLLGDCRTATAVRLMQASRGADALSVCEGLAEGLWRDECFFLTAEAAPLKEARAICSRAGRLRSHCQGHLFGAALGRLKALAEEPGREDAVRDALAPLLSTFPRATGGARVPRAARERALLVGMIAWRVERTGQWNDAVCGTLPRTLCLAGYRSAILGRPEWPEACARAAERPWIRELGLPDPGPTAEGGQVWQQLCADFDAGRVDPAHPAFAERGVEWGHKKKAGDVAANPLPRRHGTDGFAAPW